MRTFIRYACIATEGLPSSQPISQEIRPRMVPRSVRLTLGIREVESLAEARCSLSAPPRRSRIGPIEAPSPSSPIKEQDRSLFSGRLPAWGVASGKLTHEFGFQVNSSRLGNSTFVNCGVVSFSSVYSLSRFPRSGMKTVSWKRTPVTEGWTPQLRSPSPPRGQFGKLARSPSCWSIWMRLCSSVTSRVNLSISTSQS